MSHPDIKIHSPITRDLIGHLQWWNGSHPAFSAGYYFVAVGGPENSLSSQTLRFILDQLQVANRAARQ